MSCVSGRVFPLRDGEVRRSQSGSFEQAAGFWMRRAVARVPETMSTELGQVFCGASSPAKAVPFMSAASMLHSASLPEYEKGQQT